MQKTKFILGLSLQAVSDAGLRHMHGRCTFMRWQNSQDPRHEVTQGESAGASLLLLQPGAG